jgi:uncharacterized membrane protein YciS (DUF1049 family)
MYTNLTISSTFFLADRVVILGTLLVTLFFFLGSIAGNKSARKIKKKQKKTKKNEYVSEEKKMSRVTELF